MTKFKLPVPRNERLKSALVATAGTLVRTGKSPDESLGDLFSEVQRRKIYDDGKTFADLVPRARMRAILDEYRLAHNDPDFDLREFVNRHFYEFTPHRDHLEFKADASIPVTKHISLLWDELKRSNRLNRGSLLALPHPYIVPGGRFSEQFYWDSYFIMLGLAADDRWDMIEGMMKNFTFMIRKFGYIPTANRTYFLSRSQPPFFSHMVKLLSHHKGRGRTHAEYLPYMLAEYRFWMKGRLKLQKREHKAFARVVEMPDGSNMNRYYDNKTTPRPESLREDIETVESSNGRQADRVYLHLRAGAESGWDFSSRWLLNDDDISSIHTADVIPVDLNCLLYHLESTIAESYRLVKNPLLASKFQKLANTRKRAILHYSWNEKSKFFEDYNFHHGTFTGRLSIAGIFPLYVGIASKKQADFVAKRIERDFLKPGGLVTTLEKTGQQWDSPNGWAPLQWVAICGLKNYGYYDLANHIKNRWVKLNTRVYLKKHKLVEKYNVEGRASGLGGGGEYPLQDGFGWTNGVLAALMESDDFIL
ncbi:alpha,alpha-trehalase TreF [Candidatus Nomurabacteria bacterium]|nr:alpha,alpha-trehalase TreF [Candidatus Nomurabacteria bacterium]